MRSKIWCFYVFCRSHRLLQLAAFFIEARAKTSIAKSYIRFDKHCLIQNYLFIHSQMAKTKAKPARYNNYSFLHMTIRKSE